MYSSAREDALHGTMFGIIGIIVLGVFILVVYSGLLGASLLFGWAFVFPVLAVVFVFYILMAARFKEAFKWLSMRSGKETFKTAGSLLFWGAFLTIILVGLILIFVGWVLAAVAFSSMERGVVPPPPELPPVPMKSLL